LEIPVRTEKLTVPCVDTPESAFTRILVYAPNYFVLKATWVHSQANEALNNYCRVCPRIVQRFSGQPQTVYE